MHLRRFFPREVRPEGDTQSVFAPGPALVGCRE